MIYELDGQKPDLPQEGRYWIAPSAAVIGKVRLKNDSSVWFHAVMRGPMKAAAREDDCLSRDQPSAGRLGLLNGHRLAETPVWEARLRECRIREHRAVDQWLPWQFLHRLVPGAALSGAGLNRARD